MFGWGLSEKDLDNEPLGNFNQGKRMRFMTAGGRVDWSRQGGRARHPSVPQLVKEPGSLSFEC